MVKLELDNVYVKITGLTKEQEYTLWSRLAFRVEVFGVQEVRYRHLFYSIEKLKKHMLD